MRCLLLTAAGLALMGPADDPVKDWGPEELKILLQVKGLEIRVASHYGSGRYAEAAELQQEHLRLTRQLFPASKFPDGHSALFHSLNTMGGVQWLRGRPELALGFFQEAHEMCRKLYPSQKYPEGHPDLALSWNNQGGILRVMGRLAPALEAYQQALAMQRKLYPPAKYPEGHPSLAISLNNVAEVLQALGRLEAALENFQQSLAMRQKLFPPSKYPDGHRELAHSLSNIGGLLWPLGRLEEALEHHQQALAMRKKLFPSQSFPNGHPELAVSLNYLGLVLHSLGREEEALDHYRQALAMRQKLYPVAKYPNGHPDLARSWNNIGHELMALRRLEQALEAHQQALAMYQKLYPPQNFPNGQPELALSLHNLAGMCELLNRPEEGLNYAQQALTMRQKLYPPQQFPEGHPLLASTLDLAAKLLNKLGRKEAALESSREALVMYRKLYSPPTFPVGHPDLAHSLHNTAVMLTNRGQLEEALAHYREAVEMNRKLYPKEKYPGGHPAQPTSLTNLGYLLQRMDQTDRARQSFLEALSVERSVLQDVAGFASEAETLALIQSLARARNGYLSVTRQRDDLDPEAYRQVWLSKAFVTRLLQQRQLAARQAEQGSPLQTRAHELQAIRRQIEQQIAGPAANKEDRDQLLAALARRRNELERELARLVPKQAADPVDPAQLQEKLPGHSAFIDFLRYNCTQVDRQATPQSDPPVEPHYAAFVVAAGQPVRRIELGLARPIDEAIAAFRNDLLAGRDSPQAGTLARLLIQPLAAVLPPATQTVFLAPDGDLARLPFAALPSTRPGSTLLLEDFTLVHVLHGPFLLQRLLHPWKPVPDRDGLLLLGNLDYGPAPQPGQPYYPLLPATAEEVQAVRRLAGSRPTVTLEKTAATAERLRQELPGVRFALLATHGYFDEKGLTAEKRQRAEWLKTGTLTPGQPPVLAGRGSLSPLAYTGLVLAEVNRKETSNPGILTGETLGSLRLEGLELAVLSACESGLGELTEGEGVVGQQRSLHLAGCRDVVASLWKVPDGSTAVLMEEFHRRLWDPRAPLPAAQALRQAQLWVYHHPDQVQTRLKEMRTRGIDLDLAELPNQGAIEKRRLGPARWWAGFVLSGDGGLIR